MRRMGFCEEKGSGMDKVFFYNELYQLPPINVLVVEHKTRVTIYSYKALNDLDKKEKIRACYQHACLKYVSNDKMTNQSLRDRFKIEDQNAATASRIIRDAFYVLVQIHYHVTIGIITILNILVRPISKVHGIFVYRSLGIIIHLDHLVALIA